MIGSRLSHYEILDRIGEGGMGGGHGLDVSPDGRTLLFGEMDGFSEDLLLIENVR
jgi:hypothetical protein